VTTEDPRDHAVRKFDAVDEPPLWTALDVVVRYATDPPLAVATLLDALRPAAMPGAQICEFGFGPGWFLEEMLASFPDVHLHGLDMSYQAVTGARRQFGSDVSVLLGDMERLPFANGAFDAITTNWTLYFMRDIDAALAEMRRCIRPGGLFVAATVAPDHMIEFDEMAAEAVRRTLGRERDPDIAFRFDTTTGMPFMHRAFEHVELREYSGEMVLPDVATSMILWPGYGPQLTDPDKDAAARAEFQQLVTERINRDGALHITRHDGVFIART
jgi:ubiquinone/menaquinone biosynthesis C-methylase UbiE